MSKLRHELIREAEAESLLHGRRSARGKRVAHGRRSQPVEVKSVIDLAKAEIRKRTPNARPVVWRPGFIPRALANMVAAVASVALFLAFCAALGAAAIIAIGIWL